MKNKNLFIGILVGVVGVYVISTFVVENRIKELTSGLDDKLVDQEKVISDIAVSLGKGSVNEKVSAIIAECPFNETEQYDRLLASLDKGLTKAELQGLNILFKRCGDIPAMRRAVMTLLLEKEVAIYTELVYLKSSVENVDVNDFNLSKWNALVEREKETSSLFYRLVDAQDQIISTLADGGTLKSVEGFQLEAGKIQTELTAVANSANEIRQSLIKS